MEKKEPWCTVGQNADVTASVENSMEVPQKLKIEPPYGPSIPLIGIHSEKLKTAIRKDTCTPVIIATLFTTAKTWKQPKGTPTEEWIKKIGI